LTQSLSKLHPISVKTDRKPCFWFVTDYKLAQHW